MTVLTVLNIQQCSLNLSFNKTTKLAASNGRNAERSKLEKWVGLQIRLLALIRIVMEKNKGETNHSSVVDALKFSSWVSARCQWTFLKSFSFSFFGEGGNPRPSPPTQLTWRSSSAKIDCYCLRCGSCSVANGYPLSWIETRVSRDELVVVKRLIEWRRFLLRFQWWWLHSYR
jgi:hypothetical protein